MSSNRERNFILTPFIKGGAEGGGLVSNQFYLPYNLKLKDRARAMRRDMPEPEKRLWFGYLRQMSVRVLRQKPIDNYIVDFYCAKARLVIEIDGESHFVGQATEQDAQRTKVLEEYGLKIMRFTNEEVMNNFEGVCEKINKVLNPPFPACR